MYGNNLLELLRCHMPLSMCLQAKLCVQVASLLGNALGMIMPSTVVFDYPTIDALSGFVAASMVQPFPTWNLLPSLQALAWRPILWGPCSVESTVEELRPFAGMSYRVKGLVINDAACGLDALALPHVFSTPMIHTCFHTALLLICRACT